MPNDDPFTLDDPIDGPDKEANEATLQAKLQEYRRACEQEFETGVKYEEGKLLPSEIRDKSKELLTQAVPKAVARLLYLTEHGMNEGIQYKAATYIIDKAIGKEIGGLVGDPLEELMASMKAKATTD